MRRLWIFAPLVLSLVWACGSSGDSAGSSASSAGSGSTTGGAAGHDAGPTYADPYSFTAWQSAHIGSDSSKADFHMVTADVDFGSRSFAGVKLVVDLESPCFPFSKWSADPPPSGQNWPADCDAFDRNFELSLDDPGSNGGPPGLELERAITPFGGPLHLEIDITDVANGLPGKHTLRTTIPTYSDGEGKVSGSNGGWLVSAHIDFVPGPAPRKVLAVVPLFYGDQTMTASPAPIGFTVPEDAKSGRLEWRATGHGGAQQGSGCIGPAEEFCHRKQTLVVDGTKVEDFDPWRTNCKDNCTVAHQGPADAGFDYCEQNPCGDMGSVKASRANWCPGTETPPFVSTAAPFATPGDHQLSWTISTVVDGGQWHLSAVYFAFGE